MKISIKTDKETFLKILKESNFDKKLKIFSRLDDLSEADRIKILLKVLEDCSWYLREQATKELSRYGNKIVPRLKKLCNKGFWYTRAAACRTLGEIGDLDATETIIKLLLKDDNPTVIKEARIALTKLVEKNGDDFFARVKEIHDQHHLDSSTLLILNECLPGKKEQLERIFRTEKR